ncbi:MAG: DPP IV N-terminal domain-containing protein [Salinivirgaceae bacterium]|nr:DPP IV N-terminal domain-containing protein [Salinivirgaceae bacterium]
MKKILLLCAAVAIITNMSAQEKEEITIDKIFKSGQLRAKSIRSIRSMDDGNHYTTLEDGKSIVKYSYKTGKQVAVLASVNNFGDAQISTIDDYEINSKAGKILFYTNRQDVYRRSFYAKYYVWDIANQKLEAIENGDMLQMAILSPDGTKVAFIRDNNLYVSNFDKTTQVTTDGTFNKIINGIPDWVYEEEFEYNKALCWSVDSRYVAWCRFDETLVPQYSLQLFAGQAPKLEKNKLYPSNYSYKYPKAGEDNSIVSVWTYNANNQKVTKMDIGTETDQYIPRIKWSPAGKLVIYRLNRLQNHLEMLYANADNGKTEVFYSEKNDRYIDEILFDNLTFNADGSKFLFTNEQNGWVHIYLYNADGTLINQVTNGNFDVTEFYGYDEGTQTIYYQSAEPKPSQRTVYSIKTDGSAKKQLSTQVGTNEAYFSSNCKFYINNYSSTSTPNIYTLNDNKGKTLRTLEDNANLKNELAQTTFSAKELIDVKLSDSLTLCGWIIKPHNFDSTKKYPVLMIQYSGPNSQQVLDRYSAGWEQALSAKGYIVLCCDGRGTGARGEEFRKCTYLQLGKYEVQDQISVAKWAKTLPFVDAERIGIWGWSFGGFMVLNCMTQSTNVFRAGIAVAPVTNWRYYDNIYTERFMRKPQDNAAGYDNNSPITHAANLNGSLLLMHGSADDNVHWQNSAEMSEAFVQAGKQFDYFVFTNRNHSIYGGNTSHYIYTKMLNFIMNKL